MTEIKLTTTAITMLANTVKELHTVHARAVISTRRDLGLDIGATNGRIPTEMIVGAIGAVKLG